MFTNPRKAEPVSVTRGQIFLAPANPLRVECIRLHGCLSSGEALSVSSGTAYNPGEDDAKTPAATRSKPR